MTLADQIAEWLHEKKIAHAFGIIGAGNLAIFDAVARLAKTRLIACHHEQAAVMAAGFYWRTSGRLACAIVTTGAGSSNALTGVLAAFMDSTPLIVISGNEPSGAMTGKTRVLGVQGYDSRAVAAPFTKQAYRVRLEKTQASENLKYLMDVAVHNALTPRFGPVWLDVSRDIQTTEV